MPARLAITQQDGSNALGPDQPLRLLAFVSHIEAMEDAAGVASWIAEIEALDYEWFVATWATFTPADETQQFIDLFAERRIDEIYEKLSDRERVDAYRVHMSYQMASLGPDAWRANEGGDALRNAGITSAAPIYTVSLHAPSAGAVPSVRLDTRKDVELRESTWYLLEIEPAGRTLDDQDDEGDGMDVEGAAGPTDGSPPAPRLDDEAPPRPGAVCSRLASDPRKDGEALWHEIAGFEELGGPGARDGWEDPGQGVMRALYYQHYLLVSDPATGCIVRWDTEVGEPLSDDETDVEGDPMDEGF